MDTARVGPGAAVAVAALLGGTVLLGACGSSGHPAAQGSALARSCADVTAVLGNGPDPDADPVGYAAAQPTQLRKVVTSDAKLRAAIVSLASAYAQFAATSGSGPAKAAVASASARLDAVCPGATS